MKKRKVIKNTPIKLPIQSTILYSFLLYHFNVDRIYWGIFIALYSIRWILAIIVTHKEESVDLFEEKEIPQTKFADRIAQILKDKK